MRRALALAWLGLTAAPAVAYAADEPVRPEHRIEYTSLTAVRLNPLGLSEQLELGYRYRLYEDPAPLFRDAFLGGAAVANLTPSFARLGGKIEIRPLTILLFSAGYYFHGWFGSFDALMSYPSPRADYSDTRAKELGDQGLNAATTGAELELRGQVLAKVGPIVLRSDTKVSSFKVDIPDSDRVFYDSNSDIAVADRGMLIQNDEDLVYFSDFGLVAGARLSVIAAPYRDAAYLPGEPTDDPNGPIVRLGPLMAYTFYDEPESSFNKPTVIAIAGWHLAHRFRTGADVSQAVPYVALAFRVEGNVWDDD